MNRKLKRSGAIMIESILILSFVVLLGAIFIEHKEIGDLLTNIVAKLNTLLNK